MYYYTMYLLFTLMYLLSSLTLIYFCYPYYIIHLFTVYNFMAAANAGIKGLSSNLCLEMDHLGNFADSIYTNESKLRYSESVSMITM